MGSHVADVLASDGNPAIRAELTRDADSSGQDVDVAAASHNASTGEVASAVDVQGVSLREWF